MVNLMVLREPWRNRVCSRTSRVPIRKFEIVKGAMSAIGLYKKLYEHSSKGHVVCFR